MDTNLCQFLFEHEKEIQTQKKNTLILKSDRENNKTITSLSFLDV